MMIKEHFIERYGIPAWTIGYGGSGGAIQQLLIAQNFPGLLDGILPSLTYPDSVSVRPGVTDCRLLMNYYKAHATAWTPEKQTAVEGYTPKTCSAWDRSFIDVIVATNARGCGIPADQVYDPVKNPKGVRCTMWETNVATFGRDPATGFARRSLDNVGVQYRSRRVEPRHHLRGRVPRSQREDRRLRQRRPAPQGAERRRSGVVAADLCGGPPEFGRRRPRLDANPPLPQLQRRDGRHPRSLPRLQRARAAAQGERPRRQPGDLGLPERRRRARPEGRRARDRHHEPVARCDRQGHVERGGDREDQDAPSRPRPSTAAGTRRARASTSRPRSTVRAAATRSSRTTATRASSPARRLPTTSRSASSSRSTRATTSPRSRLRRCSSCAASSPRACATTASRASTSCRSPGPI